MATNAVLEEAPSVIFDRRVARPIEFRYVNMASSGNAYYDIPSVRLDPLRLDMAPMDGVYVSKAASVPTTTPAEPKLLTYTP